MPNAKMPIGVATQIVLFLFDFTSFKNIYIYHFRGILGGIFVGILRAFSLAFFMDILAGIIFAEI